MIFPWHQCNHDRSLSDISHVLSLWDFVTTCSQSYLNQILVKVMPIAIFRLYQTFIRGLNNVMGGENCDGDGGNGADVSDMME